MATAAQLQHISCTQIFTSTFPPLSSSSSSGSLSISCAGQSSNKFNSLVKQIRSNIIMAKAASSKNDGIVPADGEDGVSLGTMKLPPNIDIPRFESLLFQWANSLCQGSNLPLPLPLKVDKVEGGARLCFVTVDDGETQVLVYIDCLIFPASESSAVPLFRAVRNGLMKEKVAPGEPRIMRSLQQALQKSVELART